MLVKIPLQFKVAFNEATLELDGRRKVCFAVATADRLQHCLTVDVYGATGELKGTVDPVSLLDKGNSGQFVLVGHDGSWNGLKL